ncbi:MAG: hypothetical protein ACREA4_11785, partial [Nitrososphaera sp.]
MGNSDEKSAQPEETNPSELKSESNDSQRSSNNANSSIVAAPEEASSSVPTSDAMVLDNSAGGSVGVALGESAPAEKPEPQGSREDDHRRFIEAFKNLFRISGSPITHSVLGADTVIYNQSCGLPENFSDPTYAVSSLPHFAPCVPNEHLVDKKTKLLEQRIVFIRVN